VGAGASSQPRAERHDATTYSDAADNDSGPRERAVVDEIAPTWAQELAAKLDPSARATARLGAAENDSGPRERAVVDECAHVGAGVGSQHGADRTAHRTTGRGRK
jgi:hypothetical protein